VIIDKIVYFYIYIYIYIYYIYIDTNKQRPSQHSKYKDIKIMGYWIGTSQSNYRKKINNMKDETIYKL
jgi:hypothetical protein